MYWNLCYPFFRVPRMPQPHSPSLTFFNFSQPKGVFGNIVKTKMREKNANIENIEIIDLIKKIFYVLFFCWKFSLEITWNFLTSLCGWQLKDEGLITHPQN